MKRGGLFLIATLLVLAALAKRTTAPVPVTVWGYVYMPDGSPAAGASVTVRGGGDVKSTTTSSSGKYSVTLSVGSVPVKITVVAKKGEYKGSASKTGEGVVRIDVKLKPITKPSKPKVTKTKPKLALVLEAQVYANNRTVVVNGSITPAMETVIEIRVVKPSGVEIVSEVKTEKDGTFSCSFVVDEIGVWKIEACFKGSDKYYPASSGEVMLYVKMPYEIEVAAIVEAGERRVRVEGGVEPPHEGVPVQIYASFDGGKTWMLLGTATTGEGGKYEIEFELGVYGNVLFKAVVPETNETLTSECIRPAMAELSPPEVEQLRRELEALREEKEQLESEREQLESKVAELEGLAGEVEQLRRELEALKTERDALAEELASLKEAYSAKESELESTKRLVMIAFLAGIAPGAAVGALAGLKLGSRRRVEKREA